MCRCYGKQQSCLWLMCDLSRLYVCTIRSLSLDKNGLISVHLGRKYTTLLWLCLVIYVIGFEKRAHFAQSINFRYGLNSCSSHITCVSHEQKQLQTPNKVQLEAYWLLFCTVWQPQHQGSAPSGPFSQILSHIVIILCYQFSVVNCVLCFSMPAGTVTHIVVFSKLRSHRLVSQVECISAHYWYDRVLLPWTVYISINYVMPCWVSVLCWPS